MKNKFDSSADPTLWFLKNRSQWVNKNCKSEFSERKQRSTRHRPMAHLIVFRYLSYSTTLAKHAVQCLRRCPAFGRAGTCLFSSVQWIYQWVSDLPTWWLHDHGLTNVVAMVKSALGNKTAKYLKECSDHKLYWKNTPSQKKYPFLKVLLYILAKLSEFMTYNMARLCFLSAGRSQESLQEYCWKSR